MTEQDVGSQYLLQVDGVSKRFPGVLALDNVSLNVRYGEIHALMGENGAGKSTLMKIIGGVYQRDGGKVLLEGKPYAPENPSAAQLQGVSLIHQELNLVPDLTIAQNIFLGREPMSKVKGFMHDEEAISRSQELLDRVGVSFNPKTYVRDLSVAGQQMVEIAKALSFESKLLVMDEPTAALSEKEVDTLFALMREFISPTTAIIYISHRMEELMRISDRITVFRDGQFVQEVETAKTNKDEIVKLMVGRKITPYSRDARQNVSAQPVLEARHVSTNLVKDVSFDVKAGEILGIGGLEGAGRTELARCVIGADQRKSGDIFLEGKPIKVEKPFDAVNAGIAYLSEDRKQFGLVLDESVNDNIMLPSLRDFTKAGLVRDAPMRKTAAKFVSSLSIKTPSNEQLVKNLSGGNQQKVVVAKWLAKNCKVLIFDEPTRGIDVGAKQEIYTLLDQLAKEGHAIVVISSEMEELLRLSDRILVMCNGALTGELSRSEATQEKIMQLATQFDKTK
ncbi:sugar ABC transporter ATP-binding protein [Bifidobacterium sp. ESL0775]|uniref:sugar ABC transporter ATP-binding protein n=1 Tax=Bifidobacterium sp. ESL0775 TaxID=2983230 RepID=UPI0023F7DBD9|nr:sugar ABC transporter ATP-binding protein [Bifidobacterium sp. ESL0775]WEV69871.1 sugar ABC transporter ATP-binding protein [Bifidobacterium sp. ESL0775]